MASRKFKLALSAAALVVVLAAVLLELMAQAYCMVLKTRWEKLKAQPNHLFQATTHPGLPYELKRNYTFQDGHRKVFLNEHGIRDSGAVPVAGRFKLALLGDSVVFGQNLDEGDIFPVIMQEGFDQSGASVRVLNLGVPGYDASDVYENLVRINAQYDAEAFCYFLNLNDFARKDTRFEGADNGLYRMYQLPLLKTPMFLRKAIYRYHKGGQFVSVGWYRWLFAGNKDWGVEQVQRMQRYAHMKGRKLILFLYPAGCAYSARGYELQEVHNLLKNSLTQAGIRVVDLAPALGRNPQEWFDFTDHLTPAGNKALAEILLHELRVEVLRVEVLSPIAR